MTHQQLIDFVYAEARLLDELRFDDWLNLFTEDGVYWMPLAHGQREAKLHASLMYEDKLLLKIRVERLHGARTYSQQPRSRCHHLLQQPSVEASDDAAGIYTTRTAFHYVETRLDDQTLYAGWATHTLVRQSRQADDIGRPPPGLQARGPSPATRERAGAHSVRAQPPGGVEEASGGRALPQHDGQLRIKQKRVDLVNCDAAFGSMQLFM